MLNSKTTVIKKNIKIPNLWNTKAKYNNVSLLIIES